MRNTRHNMIAQPYARQSFRVSGIVQMRIGDQRYETPCTTPAICSRTRRFVQFPLDNSL